MKVLFLTYCYPPQKFPRSVQISHLVHKLRDKFSLEVLTSPAEENLDISLLDFTDLGNVTSANKSFITKFIERSKGHRVKKALLPDLHYPWHFDLYNAACSKIESAGIDVIVTFGQPMSSHIAGLKLKNRFKHIKWIAHFSDPWVDNIFNQYNIWTKFINKYYQTNVFTQADKLIFTSQETVDLVTQGYPDTIRSKTTYLPHCFDSSLYKSQAESIKPFTIRYLGNFYGNRQPEPLFIALQRIAKQDLAELKFELIGSSGAAASQLEKQIMDYGLQDVVCVKPSVDYLQSLQLAQTSDLLLIIDAPTQMSPFLPSKLIDYIGANKPILGITPPGAAQALIAEMGFAVAHPSNPLEIKDKLLHMIASIKNGEITVVPQQIRERYAAAGVAQKFGEIIQKTRGM